MRKPLRIKRTKLTNNKNKDDDFLSIFFISIFLCVIIFLIIGSFINYIS